MSERQQQAWDEASDPFAPTNTPGSRRMSQIDSVAGRRYGNLDDSAVVGFIEGAHWADANPRRTITLAQSEAILDAGRVVRYEDHEAALRAAGIEVVDDE
jgi:hypothetical protein